MIPKKKEDYMFPRGAGRPFEMNPQPGEPTTEAERHQATVIHLGDLNGQTYDKGMPKNFHTKRGRCLDTFTKYWTKDEDDGDDEFDIE